MKISILTLLIGVLPSIAMASSLLGSWQGSANLSNRYQTNSASCAKMFLDIQQNERNEVLLHINYDCIWSYDWYFSHELIFAMDKDGNLLGEDGSLKDKEFYWNNATAFKGGTKIHLELTEQNTLAVKIEEKDQYGGNNTPMIHATLSRSANPMTDQKLPKFSLNGNWQGQMQFIERDPKTDQIIEDQSCTVHQWALPFQDGIWTQTSIYLPDCDQEKFRLLLGAYFFEYGKIYGYTGEQSPLKINQIGTYDEHGMEFKDYYHFGPIRVDLISETEIRIHLIETFFDMTIYPFSNRKTERILTLKKL